MNLLFALLHRLDEARAAFESLLPRLNPSLPIYPNWTLKELLDHMSGWDETIVSALEAHLSGTVPGPLAVQHIDAYNDILIARRASLSLEQSRKEFQSTRAELRKVLSVVPENMLAIPLLFPWGEQMTLSELVELLARHEEEHTADLLRWLEHPERPLVEDSA
ncbi:MAG: DinB family protein [Anaerolineales bacterium]|nr:DinB family protein [Anaerolineales bacterium]MCX7608074.1 DinB family protein [Anaerolineales bacterium]MDW8227697.1 DinB family protein [Anaerolineales bacterium]